MNAIPPGVSGSCGSKCIALNQHYGSHRGSFVVGVRDAPQSWHLGRSTAKTDLEESMKGCWMVSHREDR